MKEIFLKNKKLNWIIGILIITGNGLLVINAFMNLKMTDAIINKDIKLFGKYLLVVVAIMILKSFQGFLYGIAESKMLKKTALYIRKGVTDKIINYSHEEYYLRDSGVYTSWYSQDVDQIMGRGVKTFYIMINQIVAVIGALVGAILIHWSFALIFPFSLGITLIMPKLFADKMQKAGVEYSEANGVFISNIKNIVAGFSVFLSANRTNEMRHKINEDSEKIEQSRYKYNKTSYIVEWVINNIAVLSQMMYIVATGWLVVKGVITPGAVIGLMSLAGLFFGNAQQAMGQSMFIKSISPIYRKIVGTENKTEDALKGKKKLSELKSEIEIKNLFFKYKEKELLYNDFNLILPMGKKYGFVGKSGTGKTTLLKLLSGYLTQYEGKILFDGLELKDIEKESLWNSIQIINQNTYIFNESLQYNITLGDQFSSYEMESVLKKTELYDFANQLPDKYNYIIKENGKNLSGGQKQRIAIARALIRKKKVLFIDEGTSSLDKQTANSIENNILNDQELTVLMISHHLSEEMKKKLDKVIQIG